MSKGGAGKVYFVLYLAVILELLIIFIERDEAEERLRKEQQQAILIVQTILSQLQTGSGTTGITVQPKDNIVLDEKNPNNNIRNYDVAVAVGDARASIKSGDKVVKGDDVPNLTYTVSHTPNDKLPVEQLGPDTTDIASTVSGAKIFEAMLGTDIGSYTEPKQTFGTSIPASETAHYFFLNDTLTGKEVAAGRRAKVFSVNFKPNVGAGWYRLRFNSLTNKILGISGTGPSATDTIRIGTVNLTVKQLQSVQKAMAKRGANDTASARVASYINTLLTPNAYRTMAPNMGFQSFNVHVVKPEAQKPQDPVAQIIASDTTYWYTLAPFVAQVKLGPTEGHHDVPGANLATVDQTKGIYAATWQSKPGLTPLIAKAENAGKVETSEKLLSAEEPQYRGGVDKWKGLRAMVSRKYNPSSEWVSTKIAPSDYQTVVEINGREVFNRAGISFKDAELPPELLVTESTKDIKATIYWKPGGTSDRTQWKPILSNVKGGALITPSDKRPFAISYPAPEQVEGFDFDWAIGPKTLHFTSGPIVLRQTIGEKNTIPVTQADVNCTDCADYGVTARLIPNGDNYELVMDVTDRAKLKPSIIGHRFNVDISMTGRGGAVGVGAVTVTVKQGR